MRLTADTNLLVRIVTQDDPSQAQIAFDLLSNAEAVFLSLPCLCEMVWVLRAVYGFEPGELNAAVRSVTDPGNVVTDHAAVGTGLRLLTTGGDFADGVIAAAGKSMGADSFVSFDRRAVARIKAAGIDAKLATASL